MIFEQIQSFLKQLLLLGLLLFLIFLFVSGDHFFSKQILSSIPQILLNSNTIFISILLEALPFILIGSIISSFIHTFVSDTTIKRMIPKNPFLAIGAAILLGIIFPLCECAIIPVVSRLIKKGLPLHVGVVFLIAAPIVNPIVYMSTFFAFRNDPQMVHLRMELAVVVAVILGLIIFLKYGSTNQLRTDQHKQEEAHLGHHDDPDHHHHHEHHHHHDHAPLSGKGTKIKQSLYHGIDEFFSTGKYLIIGAFLASFLQSFISHQVLAKIGSNSFSAPPTMMGLAYLFSLCSQADASVAASFTNTFHTGALLGFLIFGPIIDLKNTMIMFAHFKTKFVLFYIPLVFGVVYGSLILLQLVIR